MAIHNRIVSAAKATAAAIGLAALITASPASAAPVYHLTICGARDPQPGSPCYVQPSTVAPSPQDTAGLSDAAIEQFLIDRVPGGDEVLSHFITGANSSGYVWGGYDIELFPGFFQRGSFIFRQGQVLCCTDFAVLGILGINDNGLIIWQYDFGGSFIADTFDTITPAFQRPRLDAASIAALGGEEEAFRFLEFPRYLAVDNANRISGNSSSVFGAFILTPVPEPSSGLLIVGALAMLWLRGRRLAQP